MEATQQQAPAQVNISRSYRVAPEKVWQAWTDPQALGQWFGGRPGAVTAAEIDLRVGGRYRIAFDMPNGDSSEVSGVYQEVVPNRRVVFTWAWKSTPERVSRVSIDLKAIADGTQMSFVHDRFFDTQAHADHERGWKSSFDALAAYLSAQSATV